MKDIASIQTTQYILDKYQLGALKKFGQNFIIDHHIIEKIVKSANIDKDCAVVEVGPGIGALTQELVRHAGFVQCFEIDTRFEPVYEEFFKQDNINIKFGDFLKISLDDLKPLKEKYNRVILVANLPYYITTQIIEKIIFSNNVIDEMIVMVQKEVALKYTSDYKSPLTLMIQDRGSIEYMFTVSQHVFNPAPHVDSAILKIKINKDYNEKLKQLLDASFMQRRKTIYNNLKKQYDILPILEQLNIDSRIRCEQLELQDYLNITELID